MRAGLGRTRALFLLLGTSALVAPAFPAFAQAVWDGTNDSWFNALAWSTGAIPDAATQVVIDSGLVTVEFAGAEASGITLSGSGNLEFTLGATADNLVINVVNSGGAGVPRLVFNDFGSSAGNATLNLTGSGRSIYADASAVFFGVSTAGTANVTLSNYAQIVFRDDSTADSARLVSTGSLIGFQNNSNAGTAHITSNAGSLVVFVHNATANGATIVNNAGGAVDVALRSTQFGGNGTRVAIGSLSGAGDVYLGSAGVTLSALNQNDTISGTINDGISPALHASVFGGNPNVARPTGGVLEKVGTGTLTLTGNNTYTGGTIITAGMLQLGDGGTSGSILGDIANNGVLAFNRSDALTLDGVISGSGTLRQIGAGTTNLTGDNSAFTGATSVEAGALIVNGSLSGSAVTVASGARLGGSGTVGATTLASGSRITPGNSIGTLTVNGAYVQNAGAVYEVEIDPTTVTSDRIDVKGTATLASGARLAIVNYGGAAYVAGQRYTILTSTGLTGNYGSADLALTPFLSLRNSTDASNAYLSVIQTRSLASVGTTSNEVAVGTSVDSLPSGNAVQVGVTNTSTIDAARGALSQLAGEIHASARTVLVDESWLLRAAVNDRLRSAFGTVGASPMATLNYGFSADLAPAVKGPMPRLAPAERFAVWGQGYGSWGRTGSDGNAASLTRSTGGLIVGADVAAFDTLRFGVVAGYSRSTFSVNGRLSSGESDNYHLGLYGGGQWGALGLRTGVSYTWHDVSTRRGIIAAGLGDLLRADYDAGTAQVFGELGYRIELGQTALGQVALEPFAGLAYVVLHSDGFSERGGAAALSGSSDDTSLGYATLGLRAATTTRLQGIDLTLRGGLGWRYAFGDVDPKTTLAFSGSTPFTVAGLPIARNAALVEAGLDIALGANTTLGASYTAQLAKDAQDHAFKANLAVRF